MDTSDDKKIIVSSSQNETKMGRRGVPAIAYAVMAVNSVLVIVPFLPFNDPSYLYASWIIAPIVATLLMMKMFDRPTFAKAIMAAVIESIIFAALIIVDTVIYMDASRNSMGIGFFEFLGLCASVIMLPVDFGVAATYVKSHQSGRTR